MSPKRRPPPLEGSVFVRHKPNVDVEPCVRGNFPSDLTISDLLYIEHLGKGCSGCVEKREHVPTGRILALKSVQFPTASTPTPKQQAQIVRELKTFAECEHPNILSFYGGFFLQDKIYLGLEFMNGGTLLDEINELGHLSEDRLAPVAMQVLSGLHYLHVEKHLIHRDVKPSNLLLDDSGLVKITDFGVSGELEEEYEKKTTWVGTIYYMAPERIRGDPYGYDSDIWSLGLTLAEAATGVYQYGTSDGGRPLSFWELLRRLCEESPPALEQGSAQLRSFLSGCLQTEPSHRLCAKDLLEHEWIVNRDTDTPSTPSSEHGPIPQHADMRDKTLAGNKAFMMECHSTGEGTTPTRLQNDAEWPRDARIGPTGEKRLRPFIQRCGHTSMNTMAGTCVHYCPSHGFCPMTTPAQCSCAATSIVIHSCPSECPCEADDGCDHCAANSSQNPQDSDYADTFLDPTCSIFNCSISISGANPFAHP
eukprot:GEMP01033782.1.p1 GENE.GEMP01033782.1~~GEMP01033782.1.p1  ORF type:complete len:478 (+),score=92.56 GEMP01033782.1:328-1761(+)